MESNKILIGAQFIDNSGESIEIELLVLRDSTLKQLLDGIRYGLAKRTDDLRYQKCKEIYDRCVVANNKGEYRKISITSFDVTKLSDDDDGSGEEYRIIFTEEDKSKKLCNLGFLSSTRIVFDSTEQYQSFGIDNSNVISPFSSKTNPKSEKIFPEYNISTRQLYQFDQTPIEIIPPSDPPKKPKQNLFFMILPTIMMLLVMVLVRSFMSSSGFSMIALTLAMGVVTVFTTFFGWWQQKRNHKKSLQEWRVNYEQYIAGVISEIQNRKITDTEKLNELYPDIDLIIDIAQGSKKVEGIFDVSGNIFSRSQADSDFLTVRLGTSNEVENMFEIKGDEKNVVFSPARFEFAKDEYNRDTVKLCLPEDDNFRISGNQQTYLSNLPNAISKKYRYLTNAPLLFSLKNCGALGIVSENKDEASGLLERMIFELCYYHSPEDLQFVMLFEKKKNWDDIEQCIRMYKFLPHFRGLFSGKSQFVFDSKSANSVFTSMLELMKERSDSRSSSSSDRKFPHIVFVVYEEYGLKEHAFAEYLPEVPESGQGYVNNLGITFVFSKRFKEHLPGYCNEIIGLDNGHYTITPHEDENKRKSFVFDCWTEDVKKTVYSSYKILSAICYSQISQNGKVPSNVSLFELFGIKGSNGIDVGKFWGEKNGKRCFDVTKSLAVPLGKNENGVTFLDLHEKSDGPHMLVAGTTGSGKSETILSYLLGLCLQFRPDEINLMLVDMKGGGFIKRIGDLPHVVGKVTNVDGDENGTGEEYMLRRFLNALAAEVKEREVLFNQMGVDCIDDYIKACRNIESHIKTLGEKANGKQEELRRLAKERPLAHLILVVDEFTELKRFSAESNDVDFISEITTIARVGRSLGFHIILVSQNIEGAITEDIRVNSKSRLCLKVATRQASKEMINSDLAAAPTMPGNGRAYLLVGTGSKFEYFQSAYSGTAVFKNDAQVPAEIIPDIEVPVEIVQAEKKGEYTVFYRSEADNTDIIKVKEKAKEDGKMATQLVAIDEAIKNYYEAQKSKLPTPHIVFQPPLPKKVILGQNGEPVYLSEKKNEEASQ